MYSDFHISFSISYIINALERQGLASGGSRLQQELDEFQKARAFADQLYSTYTSGGKSEQAAVGGASGVANGAGGLGGWNLNSAVDAIYRRISGGVGASGPGARASDADAQSLFTPRGGAGFSSQSPLRQPPPLREPLEALERGYVSEQEGNGGRRAGAFERFDAAAASAASPTGWSSTSFKSKHRGGHRATRPPPASAGFEDSRRPPPPDWLLPQPPPYPPPAVWGPVGYPPASPNDYSRLYGPSPFGYTAAQPPSPTAFGPLSLYQPAPSYHSLPPPPSPRQPQQLPPPLAAHGFGVDDREARAKAERLRFLEYQQYLSDRRRQVMAQSGVDPSAF